MMPSYLDQGYHVRMQTIADGALPQPMPTRTGVSLLFDPGRRPDIATIELLLGSAELGSPGAMISHRPPADEGWVELLASGLTFELHGLAPAPSALAVEPEYCFGVVRAAMPMQLEAVSLVPGEHIGAGAGLLPVVRTITSLAANFALLLPTLAVCWQPAESWMEPGYFARLIVSWLAGGPFPALGLTALERREDGGVDSIGLSFFAEQEIRVEGRPGEAPAETARLAVRVIDQITRQGRIERLTQLDSASGEVIFAEPIEAGRRVTVWRGR